MNKSKLVNYIKKNDIMRLRNYFIDKEKIVILALINIGLNLALRFSDLIELKFEQIENYEIIIIEKKTNKSRKIFLNKRCIENIKMLKIYYVTNNIACSGYLFKSLNRAYIKNKIDKKLTIQSFNRYLKQASKEVGINYNIASHSLRKTWGREYYQKYKDIGLIMKILNHSSENTTLKYIGIDEDLVKKVFSTFIL